MNFEARFSPSPCAALLGTQSRRANNGNQRLQICRRWSSRPTSLRSETIRCISNMNSIHQFNNAVCAKLNYAPVTKQRSLTIGRNPEAKHLLSQAIQSLQLCPMARKSCAENQTSMKDIIIVCFVDPQILLLPTNLRQRKGVLRQRKGVGLWQASRSMHAQIDR